MSSPPGSEEVPKSEVARHTAVATAATITPSKPTATATAERSPSSRADRSLESDTVAADVLTRFRPENTNAIVP